MIILIRFHPEFIFLQGVRRLRLHRSEWKKKCMYVCMYVCMYACIYIYIYIYIYNVCLCLTDKTVNLCQCMHADYARTTASLNRSFTACRCAAQNHHGLEAVFLGCTMIYRKNHGKKKTVKKTSSAPDSKQYVLKSLVPSTPKPQPPIQTPNVPEHSILKPRHREPQALPQTPNVNPKP